MGERAMTMKFRATCEQEKLGTVTIIITSDIPEIVATTYKDGRPLEVEIGKMNTLQVLRSSARRRYLLKSLKRQTVP